MYLSLTDYVQHKYAPGEPEADRYYRDMDALFGRLHELGAVVGLVADHGMRDKSNPDGSLKLVWLDDTLDLEFGRGATTVTCPITDYFVAHHGSLGSFVRVYCHRRATPQAVMRLARKIPCTEAVYDGTTAARMLALPIDREGVIVVIIDSQTCIGTTPPAPDATALRERARRTRCRLA